MEALARGVHLTHWASADEMLNLQLLERDPIRRAVPGFIERQEFEYLRHGTVTVLMFLILHSGRMEAMCLEQKDADHYARALSRSPGITGTSKACS